LTPPLRRAMVFADGRQEATVSEDIRIQFTRFSAFYSPLIAKRHRYKDVVSAPPDAA